MTSIIETIKQPKPTKSEASVNKNSLNLAASWYVAMLSKELGKKPKPIKLFGRDLVAWRDGKGNPVIMERYCSHMGASLAIGEVKDGCIQCPFHHWQYDSKGDCVSIPDIEHIPPTSRQASYVTQERYGYIWVWYGTSSPLYPVPEFSAYSDKHYMAYEFSLTVKTTVRQIIENVFDHRHFSTAHHLKIAEPIKFTLLDDQHQAKQLEPAIKKEAQLKEFLPNLFEARIESYFGLTGALAEALGLNATTFTVPTDTWPSGHRATGFVNDKEKFVALMALTPVAENQTIARYTMMVKKTGFFLLDILYYVLHGWQHEVVAAEDVPIWDTMKPELGGAYIKHDREVLKYREFYQRWVDRVEV